MIFLPLQVARLMLGLAETLADTAHRFTHEVLHPLVFGCCPIDHPIKEKK